MLENQNDLKAGISDSFETYKKLMPGIARAYEELPAEAYKAGALDGKTKRLMALCAAVVAGCRGCILYQSKHALDLGATVEELLESCAVAISLGGTMAAAETTRLVQYLKELGEID